MKARIMVVACALIALACVAQAATESHEPRSSKAKAGRGSDATCGTAAVLPAAAATALPQPVHKVPPACR